MNVLIFEWKNFGIEDICDAFKDMAIKYKCISCLLYTSPSPRDRQKSRMPSSA